PFPRKRASILIFFLVSRAKASTCPAAASFFAGASLRISARIRRAGYFREHKLPLGLRPSGLPFLTAGILPCARSGPAPLFAPLLRRSARAKKGNRKKARLEQSIHTGHAHSSCERIDIPLTTRPFRIVAHARWC